jgi:hypothetical protein
MKSNSIKFTQNVAEALMRTNACCCGTYVEFDHAPSETEVKQAKKDVAEALAEAILGGKVILWNDERRHTVGYKIMVFKDGEEPIPFEVEEGVEPAPLYVVRQMPDIPDDPLAERNSNGEPYITCNNSNVSASKTFNDVIRQMQTELDAVDRAIIKMVDDNPSLIKSGKSAIGEMTSVLPKPPQGSTGSNPTPDDVS